MLPCYLSVKIPFFHFYKVTKSFWSATFVCASLQTQLNFEILELLNDKAIKRCSKYKY